MYKYTHKIIITGIRAVATHTFKGQLGGDEQLCFALLSKVEVPSFHISSSIMATFSPSEGESVCDVTFESDIEGSDDTDTQLNGSMSDSDEEYMPENVSEASSHEEKE